MLKSYTRIIVAMAGMALFVAAPVAVAKAPSGPSASAIAFLRESAGLDPYDTSKDTHVAGQGANGWDYGAQVVAAPMTTRDGYPGVGGRAVLIGSLESTAFGSGAVVDRVRITGVSAPNVVAFKGREVDYFADGSLRNRFTGTSTIQEDGSQHVVLSGIFTGGTRRYRGAAGTYDYTGEVLPGSAMLTGHSTGKVTF
jgi:hypothetical protein